MRTAVATLCLAGMLSAGGALAASTNFITTDAPDYYRASKLDGVAVYNDKNEKVGSISEVLVSRQGKAEAVVIGVGGFLGMGEHEVAVPFEAIQWSSDASKNEDYPEKVILPGATKEELKNAPEFKYKGS